MRAISCLSPLHAGRQKDWFVSGHRPYAEVRLRERKVVATHAASLFPVGRPQMPKSGYSQPIIRPRIGAWRGLVL